MPSGFDVDRFDESGAGLTAGMSVEAATKAVKEKLFEWVRQKVPEYQNREFLKDVLLVIVYHGHGTVEPPYGDYSKNRLFAWW
jgi:hypothetical protein